MKVWNNLKKVFKKISHGTVKVTIENGQPVCIYRQAIMRRKGEETKVKVVKKTIDLTK